MCLGGVGTETFNSPLHSHSLAMDHRRNSDWSGPSAAHSLFGARFKCHGNMIRLFSFDGQRHCLAYSFIADSSLSWVVERHRVPLPGCVQVGEYDLSKNSRLIFERVTLAFEHDGRMGSAGQFCCLSEAIKHIERWQQPGSRLPCPRLPSQLRQSSRCYIGRSSDS